MTETVKLEFPIPEPFSLQGPQPGQGALAPFPEKLRQEWKKTYAAAYQRAIEDDGEDYKNEPLALQHARRNQRGLREANRVFRTPDCTCYADAKSLEDWQVILRKVEEGMLKVVTIDAKKHVFPVPQSA